MRVELPLTGWNTASRPNVRVHNLRLVDGCLVPRPTPQVWHALSEPLGAGESFVGLTQIVKESSSGVLGTVIALLSKGHASGARLWLKRFNLVLGPVPVYRTDNVGVGEEDDFFNAALAVPQFLPLGDKLYINVGGHVFDVLSYTYPIKMFQCTARNAVTNLDESHTFVVKSMDWDGDDDVNATGSYNAGTGMYEVAYTGDFVFSFECAVGNFPLNAFELPFFATLSNIDPAATKISVELYDSVGTRIDPTEKAKAADGSLLENFVLDLTDPTVMRRRSIYLATDDMLALGKRVNKIKFVGTGLPGAGTFAFRYGHSAGILQPGDGYYVLPANLPFLGLTQQTSQALPAGVGLPSAMAQDSHPTVTTQSGLTMDGFTLALGLPYTAPARTRFTAWFAAEDGTFRAVPVVVEDVVDGETTVRYWYLFDLRDAQVARSDIYQGWAFPHVETGEAPLILAAVFWNGRLVLSTSDGRLWISDAADSFAFGGNSSGRILTLPNVAYQLVPSENVLFCVGPEGIHVLAGLPDNETPPLRRVRKGRGRASGVSDTLLLMQDGVYTTEGDEITRPFRSELFASEFLEWNESEKGYYGVVHDRLSAERVLWWHEEGHWSRFVFDPSEMVLQTASDLPGQGLVLAGEDGLYTLDGPPTEFWEYSLDVPFPSKSRITLIEVEGQGRCQVSVNGLPATAQILTLPDNTSKNVFDVAVQQATARITLSGNVPGAAQATIERLWVEYEPLDAQKGGRVHA